MFALRQIHHQGCRMPTSEPPATLSDAAGDSGGVPGAGFTLTVTPAGWVGAAPAETPLLVAAGRAGLGLPSSCRNGTCRTCLCRLVSGDIHYRIDWPGVSREERAGGWILPCIAYPDSDVVLEAPAARQTA
jgi:ferredoxin